MTDTAWIDVTVPLREGMVTFPGEHPFKLSKRCDISAGDKVTSSHVSLSVHTGTHIDAPVHFLADGLTVDKLPLEALLGAARVVQIDEPFCVTPNAIEKIQPQRDERIIFRTANSLRSWATSEFRNDYIYVAPEAARMLADIRIRTLGIDYLSVGGFARHTVDTHKALLQAGICIIEGLDLSRVSPGRYDLCCLPLLIEGCDGAPARTLLKPLIDSGKSG